MSVMKTLLVSFFLSVLFCCGPRLKLVESSSQEWAGGRYETGYGTNYKLSLVARASSEKLLVEELWIGDTYFEVKAVRDLAKKKETAFDKGETIYVVASINQKPNQQGGMDQVTGGTKDLPFSYEGKALLGYTWKGKKKYLEIRDFTQLEKIIYP